MHLSPGCGEGWQGGLGSAGQLLGMLSLAWATARPQSPVQLTVLGSAITHGCAGASGLRPGWGRCREVGTRSQGRAHGQGGSHCQVPAVGPGTEALLYTDRPRFESQASTCPSWDLGHPRSSPGPHFPNNKMGLIIPVSIQFCKNEIL